jgi:hypothetical protein
MVSPGHLDGRHGPQPSWHWPSTQLEVAQEYPPGQAMQIEGVMHPPPHPSSGGGCVGAGDASPPASAVSVGSTCPPHATTGAATSQTSKIPSFIVQR